MSIITPSKDLTRGNRPINVWRPRKHRNIDLINNNFQYWSCFLIFRLEWRCYHHMVRILVLCPTRITRSNLCYKVVLYCIPNPNWHNHMDYKHIHFMHCSVVYSLCNVLRIYLTNTKYDWWWNGWIFSHIRRPIQVGGTEAPFLNFPIQDNYGCQMYRLNQMYFG